MAAKRNKATRLKSGETFTVLVENRLRFTTDEPVPVDDVIASLDGMDRIVRRHVPKAVKKLTGANVQSAELLVVGLEDGSFIEDTLVALSFGSKKDYEKFLKKIHGAVVTKDKEGKTVVRAGAVVASVILAVALTAFYMHGSSSPTGSIATVSGNNNSVIIVGAEAYNTNPQAFEKAIEQSITKTQSQAAAKAGVQMLAPAHSDPKADVRITHNDQERIAVPNDVVRAMPRTIEARDESEDSSYQNVQVKLRASDSDSGTKGWAGTIEGIVPNRTRVIIPDSSVLNKVVFQPAVRADVTITYADPSRTRPILIIIDKVY